MPAPAVALRGLAPDGGLFVPTRWPALNRSDLTTIADAPYAEAAASVIGLFAGDIMSDAELKGITRAAYASFADPHVTPIRQFQDGLHVLELFHGPTFSFKDIALQFLGRFLDHLLGEAGTDATVLGATSGDTGSAAIHAVKGLDRIKIMMLHPEGRISDIQRLQMTTVLDANVYNVAIAGAFDDCQIMVKRLLMDPDVTDVRQTTTVNSINWFRVAAQTVYYLRTAMRLNRGDGVTFVVPSGNFGNAYSAWVAAKMGAPIAKIVAATNRNDILARVLKTGEYRPGKVVRTSSPSMDIQTASNFERLVFELTGRDGGRVVSLNGELSADGCFRLGPKTLGALQEVFEGAAVTEPETMEAMRQVFEETGYQFDPHSAVAASAARSRLFGGGHEGDRPIIVCATAHPAKFPVAVKAATGAKPLTPDGLARLEGQPERCTRLPNDYGAVKAFLLENIPA